MKLESEIIIRRYLPEDRTEVSNLICRCLREVNSKDYPPHIIAHLLNEFSILNLPEWLSKMSEVAVILDGDRIIGTGSLKNNRIQTVFILPDEQSKGLGTKMICHLENLAYDNGHSNTVLDSSLSSLDFYLKRGYVEKNRIQNMHGVETFYMEKVLI